MDSICTSARSPPLALCTNHAQSLSGTAAGASGIASSPIEMSSSVSLSGSPNTLKRSSLWPTSTRDTPEPGGVPLAKQPRPRDRRGPQTPGGEAVDRRDHARTPRSPSYGPAERHHEGRRTLQAAPPIRRLRVTGPCQGLARSGGPSGRSLRQLGVRVDRPVLAPAGDIRDRLSTEVQVNARPTTKLTVYDDRLRPQPREYC